MKTYHVEILHEDLTLTIHETHASREKANERRRAMIKNLAGASPTEAMRKKAEAVMRKTVSVRECPWSDNETIRCIACDKGPKTNEEIAHEVIREPIKHVLTARAESGGTLIDMKSLSSAALKELLFEVEREALLRWTNSEPCLVDPERIRREMERRDSIQNKACVDCGAEEHGPFCRANEND